MHDLDPIDWKMIKIRTFPFAHVLKVQYCSSEDYDNTKIMVFEGKYEPNQILDYRFRKDDPKAPVAHFAPDDVGWNRAIHIARQINLQTRIVRMSKG